MHRANCILMTNRGIRRVISIIRKTVRGVLLVSALFITLTTILEVLQLAITTWQHPLFQYLPFIFIGAIILAIILSLRLNDVEWMEVIIRYWLAFELTIYGFAKIFRTQFSTPHHIQDIPSGEFIGFNLTWIYFGDSYMRGKQKSPRRSPIRGEGKLVILLGFYHGSSLSIMLPERCSGSIISVNR